MEFEIPEISALVFRGITRNVIVRDDENKLI